MSVQSDNADMIDFFVVEASEHLQSINDDLLALEQQQDDVDLVDRLFRSVHGIKGSAGMLGLSVLSQFAHKIENLLGDIRDHKLTISSASIDFLFQVVDILSQQVDNVANGQQEEDQTILATFSNLYTKLVKPSPQKKKPDLPPRKTLVSKAEATSFTAISRSEMALAEDYVRQNLCEKAIVLYQKILRDDPANSTIRQRLEETRALHAYLQQQANLS
ncbi:chemotaxis protein CheA [Candidatus Vecturithrix granuli]|uniref:Chemotaxis protein CheA n=1 Tax=Vecturithrix granuli TaxID=1499967 RepID=A0A0S6WAD9_VECG1|nr:chemotaxis protein CheA [Candidatus Vecturithrix granuli]